MIRKFTGIKEWRETEIMAQGSPTNLHNGTREVNACNLCQNKSSLREDKLSGAFVAAFYIFVR